MVYGLSNVKILQRCVNLTLVSKYLYVFSTEFFGWGENVTTLARYFPKVV